MPKQKAPYARVMLLLPNPMVEFVDQLADQLSRPGLKLNRQDAIRSTLSKLMEQIAENSAASSKSARAVKPARR